jgi:hypothetical protein
MNHVPGAHEIETFTGRFVDTRNPSDESIVLEDIAHALANICRYGGHCQPFYSVAEHAVFVSKRLERQGEARPVQLAGLHHDDAEAYLGDIPRPLKPLLGKAYKDLSDRMDAAICRALARPETSPPWLRPANFHEPEVKTADSWSLFVEARALLPSQGRGWSDGAQGAGSWELESMPSRIVTPDYFLGGVEPSVAESLFLNRHKELTS